jgi:predicted nuclease of predicted toxin-antitoxin system
MRILADENVAIAIVDALKSDGHDVVSVAREMPSALDEQVIDFAIRTNRILLTNDVACASSASARKEAKNIGVVLLRLDWLRATTVAAIVSQALKHRDGLTGKFAIIGPGSVRWKDL